MNQISSNIERDSFDEFVGSSVNDQAFWVFWLSPEDPRGWEEGQLPI
jgi:hypothetical protein